VIVAIARVNMGFASNRRRKPPPFMSAMNQSYCEVSWFRCASDKPTRAPLDSFALTKRSYRTGAHSSHSCSSSKQRMLSRADSVRLLIAGRSTPAQSRASACATTGTNRCSNAQGSAGEGTAMLPWIGICNAASIHLASSIHWGVGAEVFRLTLAKRPSTWAIVKPSRSSRWSNSDQSPLAQDRHHAAMRRAARSESPFWPGNVSNSSDRISSMVAARTVSRSKGSKRHLRLN
jgi:hypothetical protein